MLRGGMFQVSCTKTCKLNKVFGVQNVACRNVNFRARKFANSTNSKKSFRREKCCARNANFRARKFANSNKFLACKKCRVRCIWRAKGFEISNFHTPKKASVYDAKVPCTMQSCVQKVSNLQTFAHQKKVFAHDAFGAQKVSNLQNFTHKKSFRARCIWRAKCFGATCNFRARKFANSNKVFGMQDVAPECLKFRARQFCKLKTKFSACKMSGAYLQTCHRLLDKFRVLPTRRNVCFFNQDFFFQFQLQNKKCQSKPVKSAQTRKWRPRQSNKPTRRRRSNEQIRQKNRRPWKRSIASVNVVPTAGLICRTCSTDH